MNFTSLQTSVTLRTIRGGFWKEGVVMEKGTEIFASYCYGPADIVRIRQGDSTMWAFLRDSAGRTAQAVYRGCVYWQLTPRHAGVHLSLVQQFTAGQLLMRHGSPALLTLQKNTSNVAKLLNEWEAAGLKFYLHVGSFPEKELLVAAENLDYTE